MTDPLTGVRAEWQRRVVAEYGSAAATHSLVGWLLQLGASPTLLHEGTRIIDDELVHAELAFTVLRQAGGGNVTLGGVELGMKADPELSLLGNVCARGVRIFCLGETVAVRLFKRLREGCTVEVARQALDRVLIDEVRHRDFGWLLLEWLAEQAPWPELKSLIEGCLPAWLGELRQSYGAEVDPPFDASWRDWGLMPNAEYRAALAETWERDYVPRFAEYDIDAVKPWRR